MIFYAECFSYTHTNPRGGTMNILIFGPNGSGKGTQGAVVQKNLIFRTLNQVLFSEKTLKKAPSLVLKLKRILTVVTWFQMISLSL